MEPRIVIIESEEESGELPFDGATVNDSEALHQLLSLINPGDNYTVHFKTVSLDDYKSREEFIAKWCV